MRQRLVIIGAGGQARDTAWLVQEIERQGATFEVLGFVVSNLDRIGPHDSRARLLGDFSWLEQHQNGVDALALGIGSPSSRLAIATDLSKRFPKLEWPSLVHPRVEIDRSSLKLGRGVMIAAGVVGTVNVALDDFALVNVGVTLGHEATVGKGCVINHGASISGGVVLEDGVLVGTGARVLQYLRIGTASNVGAGAVVTKDVAAGTTVVGVPARPLVETTEPGGA